MAGREYKKIISIFNVAVELIEDTAFMKTFSRKFFTALIRKMKKRIDKE